MNNEPVVVGVGGSARASEAAVRYGAALAQRLDTGLRLVHVVPAYVPMAPMLPMPPEDLRETGREVMAEFATLARTLLPPERVSTDVCIGSRSAELLAAAEHAPMLVLGHAEHPVLDRLLVGATVATVAAHAGVPVVVVPSEWTPVGERRDVLVGVKSVEQAPGLVRHALEIAARGGGRVVLLHAWELQGQYDDIITARVELEEIYEQARTALTEASASVREAWPDIEVEIRVVHGQPARVLRDASRDADLLLLAKRPHALPAGHLGATGRLLLRESGCPVEIVPPGQGQPSQMDLELERGGVLRK